jgi:hypothetical protein
LKEDEEKKTTAFVQSSYQLQDVTGVEAWVDKELENHTPTGSKERQGWEDEQQSGKPKSDFRFHRF